MPIFGAKSRAKRGCASKLACGHRIGPADCNSFSVIFGKFAISQRADVGIGPYIRVCVCICFSQFFAQNRRGKGRLITTPCIKIPFPQKLSQR